MRTIGDVEPEGMCGSGLVDLLAELRRTGAMTARGAFADGTAAVTVVPERGITLSRADASHLAQAKAANAVGMAVLLRMLGLAAADLARLDLAGGFASSLDVANAIAIGFLPAVRPERVVRHGNASVRGAKALLLSRAARARLGARVARIEHVELEAEPDFFELFVDGCRFEPLAAADAPRRDPGDPRMSPAKPGLRERLATTDEFVTVTELVPWRGPVADRAGRAGLAAAHALVDDPRIAAISITDNAGGHAMARPALLAEEFLARGQDVIVHVACRDRSRNGLLSLAWELERRGVQNVLAVSGDHPVEGFEGLSRPVFDVDSVGLLALYRDLVDGEPGRRSRGRGPAARLLPRLRRLPLQAPRGRGWSRSTSSSRSRSGRAPTS